MKRRIDHIMYFRNDITAFLTHLTRKKNGNSAEDNLKSIINSKTIVQSGEKISIAQYGINTLSPRMLDKDIKRYFGAISFTETPINELHTLLEIEGRDNDLQPYGLVLVKEKLQKEHNVSPVFYINNHIEANRVDKDIALQGICSLINDSTYKNTIDKFLPLFAATGYKITAPGAKISSDYPIDFYWEREWRLPYVYGNLNLKPDLIFIGLCPHEKIQMFEEIAQTSFGVDIKFVDPQRNLKWYAKELIDARQRLNLKESVI